MKFGEEWEVTFFLSVILIIIAKQLSHSRYYATFTSPWLLKCEVFAFGGIIISTVKMYKINAYVHIYIPSFCFR